MLGRFSFISSLMHLLTSVFPRNIMFTSLQREQTLGRFSYMLGRYSFISSSMHLQGGHILAKMKFPVFALCYFYAKTNN